VPTPPRLLKPGIPTPSPKPRPGRWALVLAALILLFGVAGLFYGPAIFRIVTDQGEFEIKTDDPNIAVMLDQTRGVKVADRAANREYLLKVGRRNIKSGEYEIDVSELPAGVEFSTTKFTLKRGGEVVVTARIIGRELTTTGGFGGKGGGRRLIDTQANLVLNPGFEDATDAEGKQPAYWMAETRTTLPPLPPEPEAKCYRDPVVKFRGSASAAIAKSDVKHPFAEAAFSQQIRNLPAGVIHLRGAIKTNEVQGSAYLKLLVRDGNGSFLGECSTPPVSGTTDWKRYAASIQVPSGSTGAVVLAIKGKGTAWFDDIYAGTARDAPDQIQPGVLSPKNILTNGGFDDIAGELPKAWNPVGLGAEGITMKADTKMKRSGAASATTINRGADAQPYNWRQDVTENLPIRKVVKLTGWVKTKEANLAAVGVQVLDSNGQLIAFHTTQNRQGFKGTADWKQFTLRFPVPQGTVRIGVLAMLMGRGQVWFDDFEMAVDEAKKE
jgi:hypothetical protein